MLGIDSDKGSDEQLKYDDSAFLFFAGAVLVVVAVPYGLWVLRRIFFPEAEKSKTHSPEGTVYKYCRTSLTEAAEASKTMQKPSRFTAGLFVHVLLVVAMLYGVFVCVQAAGSVSEIKSFDPFEILGVAVSADAKEIKKAYRTLSLKWHPDKNQNDPLAAATFIQITKAYNSLTDEAAKANFQKYGNPDGPSTMKVSVGLPAFLLEQDNQVTTLIVFFVVLFVMLPCAFFCNFARQKQYHNNGIFMESMHIISYHLREDTRGPQLPEMLAMMEESRQQKFRGSQDAKYMKAVHDAVEEPKKAQYARPPVLVRNRALLWAHLQRKLPSELSPELRKDLDELLGHSLLLTETMVDCAMSRNWLITAQAVIEFRRCLVQAMDVKDSQLLQIPHINQDLLRELQRGKKKANTVKEFIETPKEERKGRLSPAQQLDVEEFGRHFPDVEISAHVEVDGEDEVAAGDVAQVVITLTRKHLQEGEAQGPVHAPFFPKEKFDVWYLFLMFQFAGMQTPRLLGSDRLTSAERTVTSKMMFEVPPKGDYTFQLHAMSDSYAGLDVKLDVKFTVVDAVVREYKIHSDDLKLEGLSMMQQMLGMQEEEEDEDSDEDGAAKANGKEPEKSDAEEKKEKAKPDKDSDSSSSDTDSD